MKWWEWLLNGALALMGVWALIAYFKRVK